MLPGLLKYKPLPNERSVRVLAILPGNKSDLIICRLEVASIDDSCKYEALSYVWGELIFDHFVHCGGQRIGVTKSLHSALLNLRQSGSARLVWIDQLCINQSDEKERSQQVRLMGQIYSQATAVVIWLGDADTDTASVYGLLHKLKKIMDFKTPQVYHLATGSVPEDFEDAPEDSETGLSRALTKLPWELTKLPKGSSPDIRAIDRFFSRPWFFRTWTFQELVLSNRCEVRCGTFCIAWDDFGKSITGLGIAGYDPFISRGWRLATGAKRQKDHRASGGRATLAYLLSETRGREVTNPQDRVYGVLGLVEAQMRDLITIDYVRTVAETFAEAARSCIQVQGSLEILTHVEVRRLDKHDFPSWVPDWRFRTSTRLSLGMRNLSSHKYFNAAGDTKPDLMKTNDWRKLGLRGLRIMQIKQFLDVKTALRLDDPCIEQGSLGSSRWSPKVWSKLWRSAVEILEIPQQCVRRPESLDHFIAFLWSSAIRDPPSAMDQLETAFRHTLVADLFPRVKGHSVEDGHFPAYQSWEYHYFRRDVPPQVLLEHDRFVVDAMFNRKFFIAGEDQDCYMGTALATAKEDDWIVVLAGGDTPMVLRPHLPVMESHEVSIESRKVSWEFISDAYVHGLMDGEAMQDFNRSSVRYEDFVLV